MGETRVDLLHLLEDLRDAYPGSTEETILTEIVANALDSGATEIAIVADRASACLTVTDNGSGMTRRALQRYHDLASTSKRKGSSIGFAGVGIKLGLLISEEVVTESRRARTHLATSWRLASKSRAPWRWIEPPGIQRVTGTTVRMYLTNALSELLDPGFLDTTLLRHFQTLFDPAFDEILRSQYPEPIRFTVNGRPLGRNAPDPDRIPLRVKVGRQRKASGAGYLVRREVLPDEERGIAVSTLGKVIRRGWDWLGLSPADADRVTGLVEVPALVESLTLNKADFVRTGQRGALFLSYRKALQEVVAEQLEAWGEDRRPAGASRPKRARALERDLRSVLADLSDAYPILTTLVDARSGGQQRLALGGGGGSDAEGPAAAVGQEPRSFAGGAAGDASAPGGPAGEPDAAAPASDGGDPAASEVGDGSRAPGEVGEGLRATVTPAGRPGRKRPGHLALEVAFESRPDDPSLGTLIESTVRVNVAHPAYRRAAAARSEGYHIALATAMALAPLAVDPADAQAFVTRFLAAWGQAGRNGSR